MYAFRELIFSKKHLDYTIVQHILKDNSVKLG